MDKSPQPAVRTSRGAKRRLGVVTVTWKHALRPLSDAAVRRVLRAALAHGGREGIELAVVFVADSVLTRIHRDFLGDPRPTDVIGFDLGEDEPGPVGELYVSVDCARRVARERGVSVARELALYLVHGALHLSGHDDHAPRARSRMRRAELDVLRALGYDDDPLPHP